MFCSTQRGGVAQTVRACGSYPQCPGFNSLHRHQLPVRSPTKCEWCSNRSLLLLVDNDAVASGLLGGIQGGVSGMQKFTYGDAAVFTRPRDAGRYGDRAKQLLAVPNLQFLDQRADLFHTLASVRKR